MFSSDLKKLEKIIIIIGKKPGLKAHQIQE
jgi:hypothetical protein